jgi:microcystin-dependent protein
MIEKPALQRRHFLARALGLLAGGAWLGKLVKPREAAAGFSDQPFIGEIRMFAGNFAPAGWAFCSGQLMSIAENEALFALIGTTYGGDGQVTFALPDLRGRAPVHQGTSGAGSVLLGEMGGVETVTLLSTQIPAHSHTLVGSSTLGGTNDPTGRVPSRNPLGSPHYGGGIDTNLAANALATTGGTQPHDNMMPSLCVNFIISLYGVFPSQS